MSSLRAVLTYHSIDESGSPISVTPNAFAAHMRSLAANRVRVLPLATLWKEVHDDTDDGGDAAAITFDDGFANFATYAAPILQSHAFPSTVFVVSRQVGSDNRWPAGPDAGVPVLPLMDWATLERMAAAGVDIGGHTRTHVALAGRPAAAIEEEIEGGASDISDALGVPVTSFAYPYGVVSGTAAACVQRRFALGATTEMKSLSAHDQPMLLPRLDAYYLRRDDGLQGWGSPRFRAYVQLRAMLRGVRGRLAQRPVPRDEQ